MQSFKCNYIFMSAHFYEDRACVCMMNRSEKDSLTNLRFKLFKKKKAKYVECETLIDPLFY